MKKKYVKANGLMLVGMIIVISLGYAVNVQPIVFGNPFDFLFGVDTVPSVGNDLQSFSSYKEFIDFIKDNNCNKSGGNHWNYMGKGDGSFRLFDIAAPESASMDDSNSAHDIDYSETNIQVEGVDEPDIVKTDGTYIYLLANSKIYIIKAYPEDGAEILTTITLDEIDVSNIFIKNDKLIVFGYSYENPVCYDYYYYYNYDSETCVNIYDISDRNNPDLSQEIKIDGNYLDSRMIGNNIYIITSESTWNIYRTYEDNETISIPEVSINDVSKKIPVDCIHYVNSTEQIDSLTYIVLIDLENNDVKQESFMFSSSSTLYVSKNNIYLTYISYDYIEPNIFKGRIYSKTIQTTIVHKISIENNEINYISNGEVPGNVINQFSMDEHNGFFRIATQTNDYSEGYRCSNVFVLNETLRIVGKVTDIAPGENMHSARFMGNRAYLVTFLTVDPFFVIDLSDPYNPEILGELKIPGYSDYLHPFDENHIIGIGKDSDNSIDADKIHSDNAVYYTAILGVKIALFDVSDPRNPIEISKVVIGDRGSYTPVLTEHKALLFDREKELLVLPVDVKEFVKEKGYSISTFQGAYVYRLTAEDGFEYKGRITHEDEIVEDSYWRYYTSSNIHRSLYIEDTLYTISNEMIKMNDLSDLSEINAIELY